METQVFWCSRSVSSLKLVVSFCVSIGTLKIYLASTNFLGENLKLFNLRYQFQISFQLFHCKPNITGSVMNSLRLAVKKTSSVVAVWWILGIFSSENKSFQTKSTLNISFVMGLLQTCHHWVTLACRLMKDVITVSWLSTAMNAFTRQTLGFKAPNIFSVTQTLA